MFSGTYLLADVPIHITSQYDEVQRMLTDYRTDLEPQFSVSTTPSEIEEEGRLSDEQRRLEGLAEYHFPASYLETLTVYRKVALGLLPLGVLLMHGSVIAVDGEAYMFTALSGTGKSTHVRLWRQLFGARAVMVNDDKPLVRCGCYDARFTMHNAGLNVQSDGVDNRASCIDNCASSTDNRASIIDNRASCIVNRASTIVYGTPWDGKHHLSNNISVPLKAIVVLKRGEQNEIHPISAQEAFPTLLQQSFRTEEPMVTLQTMQLLSHLAEHVGLYCLHCNMEPEAAEVAYRGMNP